MSRLLSRLDFAHLRVARGEKIIARQRALIDRLKETGRPTTGAEKLLATMQTTVDLYGRELEAAKRQDLRDHKAE